MSRSRFIRGTAAALTSALALLGADLASAYAPSNDGAGGPKRSTDTKSAGSYANGANGADGPTKMPRPAVAYRSLSVDMPGFGVSVPVAMWYPVGRAEIPNLPTTEGDGGGGGGVDNVAGLIMDYPDVVYSARVADEAPKRRVAGTAEVVYSHRISVKKIGELLAGWDFIPEFVSKAFTLRPTMNELDDAAEFVVDGQNVALPKNGPIVLLAHGYLGSRFDLSHLAEELAKEGFICLSPEYPESLASSYPRTGGLDRQKITSRLLQIIHTDLAIEPTSRAIIGHSLGCGTVISTGDETWTRVCIAGMPSTVNGPALFLSSVNDGAVSLSRVRGSIPPDYVELNESTLHNNLGLPLPNRAALIFDRDDAPNHISFLADSTNNAMINLLSPLLPIAQTLSIPVLDFDKYQVSRDSRKTADVVIPLITSYLKQQMM